MEMTAYLDFTTDDDTYTHEIFYQITGELEEDPISDLEDWLWSTLDNDGVDFYEIGIFRTDGNTYQVKACDTNGEIIGVGTIQTDEF